jgi:hypothetical protein
MRISETYSHLNGLEYLLVHKPELWAEIQSVIAEVDAGQCRIKMSHEKTMKEKLLFSPIDMNAAFNRLLREKSWQDRGQHYWVTISENLIQQTVPVSQEEPRQPIEAAGVTQIITNQTDYVKDRVAVEVQFGIQPFTEHHLFARHLAFYVGDRIDVGIEILPMKSLQAQMSSGVPYYEGEIYNVVRQGRGVPAVPLVIVGIEP